MKTNDIIKNIDKKKFKTISSIIVNLSMLALTNTKVHIIFLNFLKTL